jgi:hypothetical protein
MPAVLCPHCDSPDVEAMTPRSYEEQTTLTWYQCLHCDRMWSLPKPQLRREAVQNKPTPDSK